MSDVIVTNVNGRPVEPERIKAWASLKGTGTIVLRDSLNISSIADYAVGNYALSYLAPFKALPATTGSAAMRGHRALVDFAALSNYSVSRSNVIVSSGGRGLLDANIVSCQVIGNLA